MTEELKFVVDGKPVTKARPRFARGRAYTPATTVEAEERVRAAYWAASALKYGRVVMFVGAVEMTCVFALPNRRRRDWDNLAKLVCDALNGVAYRDDDQIHDATIQKRYTNDGDGFTVVTIKGEVE